MDGYELLFDAPDVLFHQYEQFRMVHDIKLKL